MDKKSSFLVENLGHIITLCVYLASFAFFVGSHSRTLEQHSKALEEVTQELKETKKDVASLQLIVKANSEKVTTLDTRLTVDEKVISKVEVLANDMEWFKKFLLEKEKTVK